MSQNNPLKQYIDDNKVKSKMTEAVVKLLTDQPEGDKNLYKCLGNYFHDLAAADSAQKTSTAPAVAQTAPPKHAQPRVCMVDSKNHPDYQVVMDMIPLHLAFVNEDLKRAANHLDTAPQHWQGAGDPALSGRGWSYLGKSLVANSCREDFPDQKFASLVPWTMHDKYPTDTGPCTTSTQQGHKSWVLGENEIGHPLCITEKQDGAPDNIFIVADSIRDEMFEKLWHTRFKKECDEARKADEQAWSQAIQNEMDGIPP